MLFPQLPLPTRSGLVGFSPQRLCCCYGLLVGVVVYRGCAADEAGRRIMQVPDGPLQFAADIIDGFGENLGALGERSHFLCERFELVCECLARGDQGG